MKRLIAILAMLLLAPAMAQELVPPTPTSMETGNIIYTTLNPPPEGTQFNWNGFVPYNTGGGGLEGGFIPAYNTQTGTFVWGFMQGTVTYNFYGNSFWPNDDSMVNGFKYSWEYFNQDFSRGFLTGNVTFFGNGNNVLESYNFAFPQTTQGWTLLSGQIDFETPYDRSQVGRLQLSFTGIDDRFWLGYYGPQIRDLDVSILYSEAVPPPIAVDCTLYPTDPTCIIQDLTTFSTEEILALTDTTTDTGDNGSNDGSEPIVEEEETLIADETTEETDLEETLQDEETSSDEEVVVTEANEREVTYRELTDEEKAAILADAISKNTLELALSVAENAATNTATATTETVATTTSRTTTVIEDTVDKVEDNKNDNDDQVADSSTDTANELLENGRQLNNVSMAVTQSQSEQTASDSISQAESIAMSSSEIKGSESIIESITIDSVIDNSSNTSNNGSEVELLAEQSKVENVVEEVVANNIEQNVEESTQTIDSFSDIMNIVIAPVAETKDEDLEFVQSILAQSEQKVDETANTFEDDEKVTIQNDPNLSNAFNVIPNTANLEILGVLSNKQDDKSDAEKRAEQVVAANAKEQEEINKNYMDADQSGIVAAMGADTDVGSYRSAMLNDNNVWYKPEDIYKNVVYKDNVRGAYFLEKGNSDTYKKMVEEQYK
jgi:hypothetical protein